MKINNFAIQSTLLLKTVNINHTTNNKQHTTMKNVITYKGIDIEIVNDTKAANPYKEWCGCVPLIELYEGCLVDYSKGDINIFLSDFPSDNQIVRHQK